MKQIQIALFLFIFAVCQLGELGYAQTLKVGMTSKTLFYLPFYVGEKKGFYKAENLNVELILIGRSDVQLQALLTGEIHFATLNADGVILVNEKGANLKVIAGVDNAAPYILVGGKSYKKIADLKGARLGVTSLRGGATSILLEYFEIQRAALSQGLFPDDSCRRHFGASQRVGKRFDRGRCARDPVFGHRHRSGLHSLGRYFGSHLDVSIQRPHGQSRLGGKEPVQRREVSQSAYSRAALDSRATGASRGVFHQRDGREAAVRAARHRLFHQEQSLSHRWLGDPRRTESEYRRPVSRRGAERTSARVRKNMSTKVSYAKRRRN